MSNNKIERKLGDEWRDWDGRSSSDTTAGKRLFITLSGAVIVLLCLSSLIGWYMVAPRLSQWYSQAPVLLLVFLLIAFLALWLALGILVLMLWTRHPMPLRLATVARKLVAGLDRSVFFLSRRLSLNSDRTAHSFIKINNEITRIEERRCKPERILILLPRCLAKDLLRQARGIAEQYQVPIAVVPGGELARQRIMEHRPKTVIGVACERDLLSGIRDVGTRLQVLGIPNNRPEGPCKNTTIDMVELREAIEHCLHQSH